MARAGCSMKLLGNVLILCTLWCCHITLAKAGVLDRLERVAKFQEGGLYNSSDNVVILNVTSFESTVLNSDRAWFVEFYNRWCGHCIRFAPIWKEFAADVAGWEAVVKIAVIDCVVEANIPLCRLYNISHFPTLRFFSAYHKKGHYGESIEHVQEVSGLRKTLIQLLENEDIEVEGKSFKTNLSPFTGAEPQYLWEDLSKYSLDPKSVRFGILVFQNSTKEVGTDLVLDMSHLSQVYARTVPPENEALARVIGVSSFPSVVVVSKENSKQEILHGPNKTRQELKSAIEEYLKLQGIEVYRTSGDSIKTTLDVFKAPNRDYIQEQVDQLRSKLGDVAFLGDIEHALRYSLRHEVSTKKQINGPVLQSLKDYLHIIEKHFPLSINGHKLLQMLCDKVDKMTEISGQDWSELLSQAEVAVGTPVWTEQEDYIGCKGSQPNFRGYPCSLWTMFHVLTVNAMDSVNKSKPQDVLKAMLGYITYFFGCTDCSQHFQSMAAETMFSDIQSHNDSVLWLWEAHNKVNKRLAGDPTEDPSFPKIQFPISDHCTKCYGEGGWIRHEVLQYLKSIYSHSSLQDLGSSRFEAIEMVNSDDDARFGYFMINNVSITFSLQNKRTTNTSHADDFNVDIIQSH